MVVQFFLCMGFRVQCQGLIGIRSYSVPFTSLIQTEAQTEPLEKDSGECVYMQMN